MSCPFKTKIFSATVVSSQVSCKEKCSSKQSYRTLPHSIDTMSLATLFLTPWMGRSEKSPSQPIAFVSVMTVATAAVVYYRKHCFMHGRSLLEGTCTALGMAPFLYGSSATRALSSRKQRKGTAKRTPTSASKSKTLSSLVDRRYGVAMKERDDDELSDTSITTASSDDLDEYNDDRCTPSDYVVQQTVTSAQKEERRSSKACVDSPTDLQQSSGKKPPVLPLVLVALVGALFSCFLLFVACQRRPKITHQVSRMRQTHHSVLAEKRQAHQAHKTALGLVVGTSR